MCGIAGIFSYATQRAVDGAVLDRMRDTMVHRGPDGAGSWISPDRRVGLAHRRLSIIDLSEAASQPMANEDGAVMVTFNGEIYNYRPLRQELAAAGHRYRTDHSDTEVLIHGYEQWGIDGLLERIEGDYAFALWDHRSGTLHLARDRIGVKPLYFSLKDGVALFASEIKAIVAHPSVSREVDPIAMYHYLSFLTTPAPLTMFKGIYKLPAGWRMSLKMNGGLEARRYWDALPGQGGARFARADGRGAPSEREFVDEVRSRLVASVEKRMMSDVPFGVFLSGGIDSSTNVALMSRFTSQPLNTFTVGYKDHKHLNELEYAERVSRTFNTRHHQVLIDKNDMQGYLGQLIHHQDEPLADWVCIPLYFVSKLAKDSGVTVVQVGEGSDEQFIGYPHYLKYMRLHRYFWKPYVRMPDYVRTAVAKAALSFSSVFPQFVRPAEYLGRAAKRRELFWSGATAFLDLHKESLYANAPSRQAAPVELLQAGLVSPELLEPHTHNVVKALYAPFDDGNKDSDFATRMVYNEFKLRLPELLLMRVDKVSMSTSVEARVPFLDHHLVELTMNLPEDLRVGPGAQKYLLKKVVRGLIPDEIVDREKMGFGAPMSEWLREDFGRHVESRLLASHFVRSGIFHGDFIRRLFVNHRGGTDSAVLIWALFNLTEWYAHWIERRNGA